MTSQLTAACGVADLQFFFIRSTVFGPCPSAVAAGFRLLDGSRGGQADIIHEQGRYLERGLLDRRDVDWRSSLGESQPVPSHI